MNKLLLSAHVVAAIIFIGPITMSASLFPRYGREALGDDTLDQSAAVARILHRVTRVYTALAITVPAFGVVLAARMGVLTDLWVVLSLVLTAVAAVILAGVVVPAQTKLMATVDGVGDQRPHIDLLTDVRRMSMVSGLFALLWVIVVVLMVLRPGSTTGV